MSTRPAACDAALEFRALTKSFGHHKALDRFDLKVPRGHLFGLVGQNGAGKTTLIKCLLDFCEPDSGEITISGVSSRATAARRDLAFLPERFTPPHYLTGRDFLRYMGELHGRRYDERRTLEVFARLDLEPNALMRAVRTYSKGMTQKLGLCACLLSEKSLQVLDEPMSGLDPKARALLKRELRSLNEQGCTVFFSSHALADVEELCDRVAIVDGGRLRFTGSPRELTAHYACENIEEAFLACIGESIVGESTERTRRVRDTAPPTRTNAACKK
jgi:ABC-2 type transport system ATP-binding protein